MIKNKPIKNLKSHVVGLVVLALMQLSDYLTTQFALRHGAVETNPLVNMIGQEGVLVVKMVAVLLIAVFAALSRSWAVRPTVTYACAASAGIVAWNAWGIARWADPVVGAGFLAGATAACLWTLIYALWPRDDGVWRRRKTWKDLYSPRS